MSATTASRITLRRPAQLVARQQLRFQSETSKASKTAADAAARGRETASNVASKASQGLSRVSSSAGPAIGGAVASIGKSLGKIGGRTGRLIGFVESKIPQAIYYSRVGLELSKLVFRGQGITRPPPVSTFRSYLAPLGNPSTLLQRASTITPERVLSRVRAIDRAQLVTGGVLAAELLGFFTVGEILGKWKVIGYHGEVHHGH